MQTVYIYLFRRSWTEEHISYMLGMLAYIAPSGELYKVIENDRPDLNAVEVIAQASPWAVKFLEHMSDCDMLYVTKEPIISE